MNCQKNFFHSKSQKFALSVANRWQSPKALAIPGKSRSLMGLLSSMVSELHGVLRGYGAQVTQQDYRLLWIGEPKWGETILCNKNVIGVVVVKIVHKIWAQLKPISTSGLYMVLLFSGLFATIVTTLPAGLNGFRNPGAYHKWIAKFQKLISIK